MKVDVDANDDSVSKILIELQSLARGSITRQNLFNSLRSELNSLRDKTNLSNTKLLKIGLAITNNSFRIDGTEKEACILLFCDLFVRSMQSSTISESFASLFLSTNFMTSSCKLATRLTEAILSIIAGANVTKISEARKVVGLISALHLLCSCQCWPILKKKPEIVSIIETLCSKILINVANKESISVLMRTITASLKGSRQQLSEGTVDQIFSIILRFLQIAQLGSDESCQIFIDLLKIPTITFMLTDDSFHLAEKCNHFELSLNWLVSHCQHEMSTTISQLTTNEALNLLSNMIFLGNKYKNTQLSFLLNWAYLVSQLLEHCSRVASDKKKSNCWHHPLLGWTTERLEDSFKWTFPRLRHQIAMLWSREMVQYLSANFLLTKSKSTAEEDQEEKMRKSSKSATYSSNTLSGEKLPAEFLQRFIGRIAARTCSKKHPDSIGNFPPVPLPPISLPVILCQLYRNALFTFQNSRIDILSNLSRDDSLVLVKLWHFIRFELDERDGLNAYLGYLVTDPDVIAPQFTPLQLFGDIAYSLISILDEKEMYESEKPFSRQQLCQIAKFTNRFCFHTICDSLIDFEKKRPAALFNSIYQLLVIMYNRDCRRPFTVDQNFWTISELNPKSFIAEFERSRPSQRAHVLMEKMPHIIPLRDRIFMFRRFIAQEKDSNLPMTIITVERSRLVEDGYRQLGGLSGQALRGTIRVKFINQQGLDEAGIDQDGVFKEFLELTLKQVFTPELNLFKCSHDKLLYPASTSSIQENHLELFNFVGRMLGKAVYEGICVDIQLAPVLLAAVLGKQLCPFDELASLDPLLYKNLTYLKHYTEDVEELSLTFSFSEEFLGKIYTYELVPGGRDLKVNNENKISYLHLMAHSRVVKQIREQTKSFVNGFRSIINEKCLSLFSIHELQFLISGQLSDIDLEDLRKHVQYYGGFHNNHRLIRWLWSILEEDFSAEERQLFLKFVTSCSRPPILGFAYLEPSFSIRCVETSEDQDQGDTLGSVIRGFLAINKKKLPVNERLPTASTCFNLLKLPNYTKRSILLAKLRYAIHAETGFELS